MTNRRIDIFEVALKSDLEITLNLEEKNFLDNLDNDLKKEVFSLINNVTYLDEVERLTASIIRQSSTLPVEQQEVIKSKCIEKIAKLKQPVSPKNHSENLDEDKKQK